MNDADILVFFCFLLDIANLLGDSLKRILVTGILCLQICNTSSEQAYFCYVTLIPCCFLADTACCDMMISEQASDEGGVVFET